MQSEHFSDVIVLNADYQFLGIASWKRAVKLVKKGRAESLKDSAVQLAKNFFQPLVIRLIKAVRAFYGRGVALKKTNLLVRDNYTCQYCGIKVSVKGAELEHVTPVSQGGKKTWDNIVISCRNCNQKKSNRTPREAGMVLRKKPYAPTIMEFFLIKVETLGLNNTLKELGIY